jgi:hypothetical protein
MSENSQTTPGFADPSLERNVIELRKKLSSECHPVLVTGSNELPEGPFLESIGFIFGLTTSN